MTTPLRVNAEFAGMIEGNAPGLLGVSAFATRPDLAWWITIDGDRLIWELGNPFDRGFQPLLITHEGALDAFVRIHAAEDVRRFAARFGVLSICEHGIPTGGDGCRKCRGKLFTLPICPPRRCSLRERAEAAGCVSWIKCDRRTKGGCWNQNVHWQPIAGWLWLAHIARAVLAVAAAVHNDERPEAAEWTFLWETFRGYHYSTTDLRYTTEPAFSAAEGRNVVAGVVGWWLHEAGVRPVFNWQEESPSVDFWGGTVGALALQLIRAASRAQSLSLCSGCGELYPRPNRAPQAGRPNYCPTCGPAMANRLRQRAHRAKGRD